MTDRYVGPGGSDGANGLSWANRKLSLNGVEDSPVAAGDTVYVGPGTYREELTIDVTGTTGNIITYIADVTGENTDGIGGIVRITGSNDDKLAVRIRCISLAQASELAYRTFRGFHLDLSDGEQMRTTRCDNIIIEDCVFGLGEAAFADAGIAITLYKDSVNYIIRRCMFYTRDASITVVDNGGPFDIGDGRIENCIFVGPSKLSTILGMIDFDDLSGWIASNCTFVCQNWHGGGVENESVPMFLSGTSGANYVYNSIFSGERIIAGAGDLTEDYNTFGKFANAQDADVSNGANSDNYPILFNPPLLMDGFIAPWMPGELAPYSPSIGEPCNSNAPNDDFFGIRRPTADAKKTRGAIQASWPEKNTTTIEGDWPYSIELPDAMATQFFVPVTGSRMKFKVKVRRETDYAGVNPQMIIKQPGQAEVTITDGGAAASWNTLEVSFTPPASPPYVIVELRSDNTASSGSYSTYFSSLFVH